MANEDYKNLVFPFEVGGPGPFETVTLTVGGFADLTGPQPDLKSYYAATDEQKKAHELFSDIVMFFHRYGPPISAAGTTDGTTITLRYEMLGLHVDSDLGKAPYFERYGLADRPDAAALAAECVAALADTYADLTITAAVS